LQITKAKPTPITWHGVVECDRKRRANNCELIRKNSQLVLNT
jgi:hypothetical protein